MPNLLIAGLGFLGARTGALAIRRGWAVYGWTLSEESAKLLSASGLCVTSCDVSSSRSVRRAAGRLPPIDAIVHCVSSGRGGAESYRANFLGGAGRLLEFVPCGRLLFTSSTSVYAQTDGSVVTEESPAEPDRQTGAILRETEDLVLGAGGIVARLAGLYGPGRSVILRKFLDGSAVIDGEGDRFVNQIHCDDAATAILDILDSGKPSLIYNIADNEPLRQRALYEWLAARLDRPVPPAGPPDLARKRGWTNKRVSNARLRELGWSPAYPSFRAAVEGDPGLLAGYLPARG